MAKESKAGRKPMYDTAEQMQIAIDAYFDKCQGILTYITDAKDNEMPMLDKWGKPVYAGARQPTHTGLALALGFTKIESVDNYVNKNAAFKDAVLRARARVIESAEQRLFLRDSAQGAAKYLSAYEDRYKQTKAEEPERPPVKIEISVIK